MLKAEQKFNCYWKPFYGSADLLSPEQIPTGFLDFYLIHIVCNTTAHMIPNALLCRNAV
jgi:hypothetical protein